MLSKNEWDPLKHVIVGSATGAQIPKLDISLRTVNYSHVKDDKTIVTGSYPDLVIREANEDLEKLSSFLISLGITVDRPSLHDPEYYHYCPRDTVCVFENTIINAPMPLRARAGEYRAFARTFENLQSTENFNILTPVVQRNDSLYNQQCVGNKDILALTDVEPSFDAANIIRANDDIFYLVSNSGNLAGARWLQEVLGSSYRVWPVENLYSYMHIDSTISFLKEGLMVLNPSRIKDKSVLPKPLQSWDVIWAPDPGDIWHYPNYCNSSKWVSMNIFSVSPELVLVEENQVELAKLINQHKIETKLLPIRHARTLGGSFHCVTVDVKRTHC